MKRRLATRDIHDPSYHAACISQMRRNAIKYLKRATAPRFSIRFSGGVNLLTDPSRPPFETSLLASTILDKTNGTFEPPLPPPNIWTTPTPPPISWRSKWLGFGPSRAFWFLFNLSRYRLTQRWCILQRWDLFLQGTVGGT